MNASFLASNILSKSACEKDQGVLVNSKLSWHDLIVNKVNKANIVLRLIRRTCETHAPGAGGTPLKGLMGTCGQPGFVFQDFYLKQGIEFIIFLS